MSQDKPAQVIKDGSRCRPEGGGKSWHAVVILPTHESFTIHADNVAELAGLLKQYYGEDIQVYPFYGTPLYITVGPTQRYLINLDGSICMPLFDADPIDIVDETGSLSTSKASK